MFFFFKKVSCLVACVPIYFDKNILATMYMSSCIIVSYLLSCYWLGRQKIIGNDSLNFLNSFFFQEIIFSCTLRNDKSILFSFFNNYENKNVFGKYLTKLFCLRISCWKIFFAFFFVSEKFLENHFKNIYTICCWFLECFWRGTQ